MLNIYFVLQNYYWKVQVQLYGLQQFFKIKIVSSTFVNSHCKTSFFSNAFHLTAVDFFMELYKYSQTPVFTSQS